MRLGVACCGIAGLMIGCGEPTAVVVEFLRVINWSPVHGAVCVGTDSTILATFSDDLALDTLSASTFYLEDDHGSLGITPEYDAATMTASLDPPGGLAYDQTYVVVAAAGLKGKTDGALVSELQASFQTVPRGGCGSSVECTLASECAAAGAGLVCSTDGRCVPCGGDADCRFAYGVGYVCGGGACVQG